MKILTHRRNKMKRDKRERRLKVIFKYIDIIMIRKMEKIIILKEFIQNEFGINIDYSMHFLISTPEIERALIKFAKLHVKAALEEINTKIDNLDIYNYRDGWGNTLVDELNKDSILNSYSLNNIK